MEQRFVGRSGLRVPRVGLGTSTWGRGVDEHDAAELVRVLRDAGGSLVFVGGEGDNPAAETVLGAQLRGRQDRRDLQVALRSGGRSRPGLLDALDASLARLGTDRVELWCLHGWDTGVPLEETLGAADTAVASGRAAYVAVSGLRGWQLARSVTMQEMLRRTPVVAAQVGWSLLARREEYDVVAAAAGLGLGVFAGAPLAGGVLTAKYRHGIPSDSRAASAALGAGVEPALGPRPRSVVDAVATAAEGLGVSALTVSLAWLLARPELSCALSGARTPAQLRAALAVDSHPPLPPAIAAALDDVSANLG